jgi:hypothetical protein
MKDAGSSLNKHLEIVLDTCCRIIISLAHDLTAPELEVVH